MTLEQLKLLAGFTGVALASFPPARLARAVFTTLRWVLRGAIGVAAAGFSVPLIAVLDTLLRATTGAGPTLLAARPAGAFANDSSSFNPPRWSSFSSNRRQASSSSPCSVQSRWLRQQVTGEGTFAW